MKTSIKCENDEFLVISLKYLMVLTRHVNPLGTQKVWAITHETKIKQENYGFLVLTIKLVSGLSSHANRPETPKTVGSSS